MHNESLKLTLENIKTLQSYWYPGNVHELQNIVERALILSNCSMLKFTVLQGIEKLIIKEISEAVTEKSILTYQDLKSLEPEKTFGHGKNKYKIYGKGGATQRFGSKPTTLISRIKALQIPMRRKFKSIPK